VGEARGVGLIGAVELVEDKPTGRPFAAARGVGAYCAGRCEANGLIVRALGDTLAVCPPLIISDAQVDELFTKLAKSLDETWAWLAAG
jgi:4-aminobutyrate--pyruvate transaminase